MNEEEVKEVVGEEHWEEFQEWLTGQTIGVNEDGSIDYYDNDVKRFVSRRF